MRGEEAADATQLRKQLSFLETVRGYLRNVLAEGQAGLTI